MITKSPYGFGYGHTGRLAGTEPDERIKPVKTYDTQDVIDACLACKKPKCTGNCKKSGAPARKARGGRKTDYTHIALAKELEAKEYERAKTVSQMFLVGWCESGIARELGLTVDEVNKSIKLARKKGLLY